MIKRIPATLFLFYEPKELIAFCRKRGIVPLFTLDIKDEYFFISDWSLLPKIEYSHLKKVPIRNPHYHIGAYFHALAYDGNLTERDVLAFRDVLRKQRGWWILTVAVRTPSQKEILDSLKRGIYLVEIPPDIEITNEEIEAEIVPYLIKERDLPEPNSLYQFYWFCRFKLTENKIYKILFLILTSLAIGALGLYSIWNHEWLLLLIIPFIPLCVGFITIAFMLLTQLFLYCRRKLTNAKYFIRRAFRFAGNRKISFRTLTRARYAWRRKKRRR